MTMRAYVPESCVWELTLRCNMRCIHCGSAAGSPRGNELTLDECRRVADELLELGCKQVTLIGGEVFLFPQWEQVAARLAAGGANVNIITNGFLFGDPQIEQIRFAKLANVGVSVDGLEESHDRTRNVKGSFAKVLKAFEQLRAVEIPIAAVTTLLAINFHDLDGIHELLADQGVSIWQIQLATAMGNMAQHEDIRLDPAMVPRLTKLIRTKRNEGRMTIYAGDDVGYFDENEMYLRNSPGTIAAWGGCQAGLRVVGIDSLGNVKGCESLCSDFFIEGNLREQSLKDIWEREDAFAYNRNFDVSSLTGKCAACDKAAICRGGCRGSCFFTSGGLFENTYCCYPNAHNRELQNTAWSNIRRWMTVD